MISQFKFDAFTALWITVPGSRPDSEGRGLGEGPEIEIGLKPHLGVGGLRKVFQKTAILHTPQSQRHLKHYTEHLFFSTLTMAFLSKRPSVLPRALSASDCPPHNVLLEAIIHHFIMLFIILIIISYCLTAKKKFVNLEQHSTSCFTCPRITSTAFICNDNVVKFVPCVRSFAITLFGSRLHVSAHFFESSSFSFCRLYQRLLNTGDMPTAFDQFVINLHVLPSWLLREDDEYLTNLSSLTVSQLN